MGFLSLRVFLYNLTSPTETYTSSGNDNLYPLVRYGGTCGRDAKALRCLESYVGDAAAWEACGCSGALDVDLTSN